MEKKLYEQIAGLVIARKNCETSNNEEWLARHDEALDYIESQILPSGSGIDSGCTIDRDKSTENKIVINSSFHLMDDCGFYDGWMDFRVVVTSSLLFGACVDVKGRFSDRNYKYSGHKEYLQDVFDNCLNGSVNTEELYR